MCTSGSLLVLVLLLIGCESDASFLNNHKAQGTKKFRSDSPGLVDFVGNFFLTCPTGKLKFSGKFFFEIN